MQHVNLTLYTDFTSGPQEGNALNRLAKQEELLVITCVFLYKGISLLMLFWPVQK